MSVNTSDPMIGRLIDGRYQVRSRIARGGMATVYLATDLRLERRVAIKIMHGHLADDSQFKQRFIQEARSAARLAHPNVVNVFDQGQDADSAYLVMEYLPGITLRDLLHDYGALTPEQTIDITEAVLSGLAAAHKAGIVHRDLKPENVLLADDGRIKIGDFGLARAASANTATGAALLGTIAYLSPELVTRGVADTRSDIYAVGIMMYEMLTGEQPYKGEQPMTIAYQHANDSVPTPSSANPKVPAELDELVLWATARDPEERPNDARAMLEQVHDTESLLQTALPTGSTAIQKTMVLPAAPAVRPGADAETQVLGAGLGSGLAAANATSPQQTGPVSDNTAALTVKSRRRSKRGWIVALVVILLAALAGGAGWWFGPGPGGRVAIPSSIVTMDRDSAAATLTDLGFVVGDATTDGTIATLDAPAGSVGGSEPAVGASLPRGSSVQLLISTGPEQLALPAVVGEREDAAVALLEDDFQLADPIRQFDAEAAEGTVLDVYGADGATSIAQQPTYGEQQAITLLISAGALPDVSGQDYDGAAGLLEDVQLTAVRGEDAYSETVAEGTVVGLVTVDANGAAIPIRQGGEVTVVVSKGLPPVTVPDVVGQSWDTARKTLEDAGLKVKYNQGPIADAFPANFTVESVDPGAGETVKKGDTVQVRLDFGG